MVDRISGLGASTGFDAGQIKEQALDLAATAREKATGGVQWVRNYTIQQPARALGIALGMGVALGWLIKRR